MRADVADEALFFGSLQDVVVLDDTSDGLRIDESFRRHGIVGILENVKLEFRGGHDGEAMLRGARHLPSQQTAWRERNELAAIVEVDVAENEGGLVVP